METAASPRPSSPMSAGQPRQLDVAPLPHSASPRHLSPSSSPAASSPGTPLAMPSSAITLPSPPTMPAREARSRSADSRSSFGPAVGRAISNTIHAFRHGGSAANKGKAAQSRDPSSLSASSAAAGSAALSSSWSSRKGKERQEHQTPESSLLGLDVDGEALEHGRRRSAPPPTITTTVAADAEGDVVMDDPSSSGSVETSSSQRPSRLRTTKKPRGSPEDIAAAASASSNRTDIAWSAFTFSNRSLGSASSSTPLEAPAMSPTSSRAQLCPHGSAVRPADGSVSPHTLGTSPGSVSPAVMSPTIKTQRPLSYAEHPDAIRGSPAPLTRGRTVDDSAIHSTGGVHFASHRGSSHVHEGRAAVARSGTAMSDMSMRRGSRGSRGSKSSAGRRSAARPRRSRGHLATLIESWDFCALDLSRDELISSAEIILDGVLAGPASVEAHDGGFTLRQHLGIAPGSVEALVQAVSLLYHDENGYHNFTHAVDVLQAAYSLLRTLGAVPALAGNGGASIATSPIGPVDAFALLLAALGHDAGHPGLTNAFLKNARAPLALAFSDPTPTAAGGRCCGSTGRKQCDDWRGSLGMASGLENFHALLFEKIMVRCGFAGVIFKEGSDANLVAPPAPDATGLIRPTERPLSEMGETIRQCILATDMAIHADFVKTLDAYTAEVKATGGSHAEAAATLRNAPHPQRVLLCASLLKCADISNPCRPPVVGRHWSVALRHEWARQRALELECGLPDTMASCKASIQATIKRQRRGDDANDEDDDDDDADVSMDNDDTIYADATATMSGDEEEGDVAPLRKLGAPVMTPSTSAASTSAASRVVAPDSPDSTNSTSTSSSSSSFERRASAAQVVASVGGAGGQGAMALRTDVKGCLDDQCSLEDIKSQGSLEEEMALTQGQLAFVKLFVLPLFQSVASVLPTLAGYATLVERNHECWAARSERIQAMSRRPSQQAKQASDAADAEAVAAALAQNEANFHGRSQSAPSILASERRRLDAIFLPPIVGAPFPTIAEALSMVTLVAIRMAEAAVGLSVLALASRERQSASASPQSGSRMTGGAKVQPPALALARAASANQERMPPLPPRGYCQPAASTTTAEPRNRSSSSSSVSSRASSIPATAFSAVSASTAATSGVGALSAGGAAALKNGPLTRGTLDGGFPFVAGTPPQVPLQQVEDGSEVPSPFLRRETSLSTAAVEETDVEAEAAPAGLVSSQVQPTFTSNLAPPTPPPKDIAGFATSSGRGSRERRMLGAGGSSSLRHAASASSLRASLRAVNPLAAIKRISAHWSGHATGSGAGPAPMSRGASAPAAVLSGTKEDGERGSSSMRRGVR